MRPRRTILRRWRAPLLVAGLGAVLGCTSPAGQLRQCQQEKEQLLAAIRQERQTAQALRDKVASLEERLDQAEKELARGASSTRLSSRPQHAPPAVGGSSDTSTTSSASQSTLPWRSPTENTPANASPQLAPGSKAGEGKAAGGESGRPTSSPPPRKPSPPQSSVRPAATTADEALARGRAEVASVSGRIKAHTVHQMLARDPRCEYDPQVGAYRLRLPLSFRDGATLTAQSKQHLDELARWLSRPELREVRVLVAGYVEGRPSSEENQGRPTTARELSMARAGAVADYLDRHGIAHERLGVSAVGSRGLLGQAGQVQNASVEVQIFLVEPDAPVLGWGPTGYALRR